MGCDLLAGDNCHPPMTRPVATLTLRNCVSQQRQWEDSATLRIQLKEKIV